MVKREELEYWEDQVNKLTTRVKIKVAGRYDKYFIDLYTPDFKLKDVLIGNLTKSQVLYYLKSIYKLLSEEKLSKIV